jgi:hypothetical protein
MQVDPRTGGPAVGAVVVAFIAAASTCFAIAFSAQSPSIHPGIVSVSEASDRIDKAVRGPDGI